MTILIAVGLWLVIVTFTIRVCQSLREADGDMQRRAAVERQTSTNPTTKNAVLSVTRIKHRLVASRRGGARPAFGDQGPLHVAG